MSTTVSTLPPPGLVVVPPPTGQQAPAQSQRERTLALLTAGLMFCIVAVSLLIVIVTADRPSFLSPTTTAGFFPHWLAGPLGGLWPGLPRSTELLQSIFTYGAMFMYLCYIGVLVNAHRVRSRWLMIGVVSAQTVYLLSPPVTLTDVGNYINYGRMEIVHHLNPYTTVPILEPHTDPSFLISNWHHLLSPYGPLFTIITFALVPLGVAASFWTIKAVLMACSLSIVLIVARCASLLGHDPRRAIAVVGLNPVVLLWGLGGDHNDPVMMLFIVTGIYLLLRANRRRTRVADHEHAAAVLERRMAPAAVPARAQEPPPAGVHAAFGSGEAQRLQLLGGRLQIAPAAREGGTGRLRAGLRGLFGGRGFHHSHAQASVVGDDAARDGDTSRPANGASSLSNGYSSRLLHPANGNGSGTGHANGRANGNGDATAAHTLAGAAAAPAALPAGRPSGGGRFAALAAARERVLDTIADLAGRPHDAAQTARFMPPMTAGDRFAPMATEIAAGMALVLAVSVKASAAILLPVILFGLLRTPRRAANLLIGMVIAAIVMGIVTFAVFGPHLPDISTQDTLVIDVSLPNLLGLALGQGGETNSLHTLIQLGLVVAVMGMAVWAWRRREPAGANFLEPAGWATFALLVGLSWVLPWYVEWLLPFVALARSKRFTRAVLIFGAYILLTWSPLASGWYSAIGFFPGNTTVGMQHAAENKSLLH